MAPHTNLAVFEEGGAALLELRGEGEDAEDGPKDVEEEEVKAFGEGMVMDGHAKEAEGEEITSSDGGGEDHGGSDQEEGHKAASGEGEEQDEPAVGFGDQRDDGVDSEADGKATKEKRKKAKEFGGDQEADEGKDGADGELQAFGVRGLDGDGVDQEVAKRATCCKASEGENPTVDLVSEEGIDHAADQHSPHQREKGGFVALGGVLDEVGEDGKKRTRMNGFHHRSFCR